MKDCNESISDGGRDRDNIFKIGDFETPNKFRTEVTESAGGTVEKVRRNENLRNGYSFCMYRTAKKF